MEYGRRIAVGLLLGFIESVVGFALWGLWAVGLVQGVTVVACAALATLGAIGAFMGVGFLLGAQTVHR